MHSTILSEATHRMEAVASHRIRLICNAAGGLLPSLAVQLQETFCCTVLPSYGMTECMPITTPPLNYLLDRPGTSGVSAGPEISILDESDQCLPSRKIGRIAVRGAPVFSGYMTPAYTDFSTFTRDGWFDTGDVGFLDEEGYLYVTGRSKEVVNRGGEIISPFEVEEAIMVAANTPGSPVYLRISEALAFSVPHDVLQEVVGVVLATPLGKPRPDIRQLNEAIKISLHHTKWPMTIVYMDSLPKKNNKSLRLHFAERLSYDPLNDSMKLADRQFEAKCPPEEASLSETIIKKLCEIDCIMVASAARTILGSQHDAYAFKSNYDGLPELLVAPRDDSLPCSSVKLALSDALKRLYDELDGYLVPTRIAYLDQPFPESIRGDINKIRLYSIFQLRQSRSSELTLSTEQKIYDIFGQLLRRPAYDFTAQSDFFDMGGDSLKAGCLLSLLRNEFQVRLPIGELFRNSKVGNLCTLVDENLSSCELTKDVILKERPLPGCTTTHSSTNPFLLCIQLLPIAVFHPIKRAFQWTLFLYVLNYFITFNPLHTTLSERFLFLTLSLTLAKVGSQLCSPIAGIVFKWLVIGRYRAGMYPMWGFYHTRWWLVEKALSIAGKVSNAIFYSILQHWIYVTYRWRF